MIWKIINIVCNWSAFFRSGIEQFLIIYYSDQIMCVLWFFYFQDGSERRTQKSNKVYEHIKKEIDIRAKRGGGPVKPAFQALSSKTKSNDLLLDTISKGLFVDANRNAAVSAGDRDLKSDVRDKKLREKYIKHYQNHHML